MSYENKILPYTAETLQRLLTKRSISLVLTDPPYGVGYEYHGWREATNWYDHWTYLGPIWDDWFRLLKPDGHIVFFQAIRYMDDGTLEKAIGPYHQIALAKWTLAGSRKCYMLDFAAIQTASRKRPDFQRELFLTKYGEMDDFIPHRCFKPLQGMIAIVELLTKPGDVVLDPYCGSGTTALACHLTGRRYICADMHPPYVGIALERLAWADKGLSPYASRVKIRGEWRYFRHDGTEVEL
ncbi:MAG: site-specific DNA-methyltransferase [Gemmataceae bacterium]|nr:site-specific DNA-methyltransferase [Gemmataceae bacterium]